MLSLFEALETRLQALPTSPSPLNFLNYPYVKFRLQSRKTEEMPYECTGTDSNLAIITHWEPLTADHPFLKQQHESHGPFHITTLVYGRGKNGLISNELAEKLRIIDNKQTTKVPPVVCISWALEGSNQNLETSQVHIVPGLQQGLILGDDTDELYQSVHINRPEEPLLRQLNTREDFEKQGILTANKRSENELKYLISLFHSKTQPNNANTNIADSEPEEIQRPLETNSESLPGATLDSISNTGSDADNYIMDFSSSIQNVSFPQLFHSDTSDKESGAYCHDDAHLRRTHSQPGVKDYADYCGWESSLESTSCASQVGSPISNWSFVEKGPGETEDQEVIRQCQRSDFEAHPGHGFWIWDRQRQLWRLRGRDGLDERDWFTELFFQ